MPEFKEFERRFKFKSRVKYGWFLLPALNLNRVLADLNRGSNSLNSISGVLIRTLLYIQRTNLSGSVKWNNYNVSRPFKVYTGVKQGAVSLSYPILYIYDKIDIKVKSLLQWMSIWRSFHGHIFICRRQYMCCSY